MIDPRTTATPEQQEEIRQLNHRWRTTEQIAQYPDDVIRATVLEILTSCHHATTPIFIIDTPPEARRLAHMLQYINAQSIDAAPTTRISPDAVTIAKRYQNAGITAPALETHIQTYLDTKPTTDEMHSVTLRHYCGIWWNVWMAWLEAGEVVGIKYDKEKYELMLRFNRHCPVWIWCARALYILRRPRTLMQVDENDKLHNDTGPVITFGDDYHLWEIHGQIVNEQIVMRPETQTIAQINADTNNDRRALRIERFGWGRFLSESKAKKVTTRKNDVEGTYEILYKTKTDGHRFVATCPTGRIICQGVPDTITTCEEAQAWLAGPTTFTVLGRT